MTKTPKDPIARKIALRDLALMLLAGVVFAYGYYDEVMRDVAVVAAIAIMFTTSSVLGGGSVEAEDREGHTKIVQVKGWHYWSVAPAAIGLLEFIRFSPVFRLEASYALALMLGYYFVGKIVATVIDAW